MTADIQALKQAATVHDGCGMQEALDAMPWNERLQALKDLQHGLGANPPTDIEIAPGSSAEHYAYRITSATFDPAAAAKALGLSPEIFKNVPNPPDQQHPRLLAAESYDFNVKLNQTTDEINLKFKYGFSKECH
jgi:hypothetical protein